MNASSDLTSTSSSDITTISGGTANSILTNIPSCNTIAWSSTLTSTPSYPYRIRAVANGFILEHAYSEYVFNNVKAMLAYIEKQLTPKK